MNISTSGPVLTKKELAARFRVSIDTLDRHIKAGKSIPFFYFGKRKRFRLIDV